MLEKIIRNIKIVGISGLIGLSVLGGCSRSDEGSLVVDVKGSSVKGSLIYLDGALVKQVSKDSSRDLDLKLKPGSYEVIVENKDYPKNYGERVAIIRGMEFKLSVDLGKTYKEIELDKYGSPEKTIKTLLSVIDHLEKNYLKEDFDLEKFVDDYLECFSREMRFGDNTREEVMIEMGERDRREKTSRWLIGLGALRYIFSPTFVELISSKTNKKEIIKICPKYINKDFLVPILKSMNIISIDSSGKILYKTHFHEDNAEEFGVRLNYIKFVLEEDLWKISPEFLEGDPVYVDEFKCKD